jgi:phenylalanine-4-hydroxylase
MIQTRPDFSSDFAIAQNWKNYGEEEHVIWRLLFERQQQLLVERACSAFLDGLDGFGAVGGRDRLRSAAGDAD